MQFTANTERPGYPVWATIESIEECVQPHDKNIEANEVTFDELLTDACHSAGLPNMARLLLPSTLSEQTKKDVMKLTPEVFGKALKTAIDEIDNGSVESIDSLVRKQLQ